MNKLEHPIKAVIFDWAGTTVDFGCFAPVQAFVEVFKEYGVEPTMEEVREPMGMLKIDHIRTMLGMPRIRQCWVEKYGQEPGEAEAQKLFAIFEEKLLGILHLYADPKPGAVEAVECIERERAADRFHHRIHRQDDGNRRAHCQRERLHAGMLVQSGFHRAERASLSLHDLPQHGDPGDR